MAESGEDSQDDELEVRRWGVLKDVKDMIWHRKRPPPEKVHEKVQL